MATRVPCKPRVASDILDLHLRRLRKKSVSQKHISSEQMPKKESSQLSKEISFSDGGWNPTLKRYHSLPAKGLDSPRDGPVAFFHGDSNIPCYDPRFRDPFFQVTSWGPNSSIFHHFKPWKKTSFFGMMIYQLNKPNL